MRDKHRLQNVLAHLNLIISGKDIEKTQQGMIGRAIYQLIDVGEWIEIFRACFVEVFITNADHPLPILLLNHHNVRQPFQVIHLEDDVNFK